MFMLELYVDNFVTQHLTEIYEALYLTDSVEEIDSNIATPGVNWLTPLIVCKVYKVNNRLEMFEKKKIYFE